MPYGYNALCTEACADGVEVIEKRLQGRNRGFYGDGLIVIDKRLTSIGKICILAEELGHHYTTVGDITDQSKLGNRQQERRAREWAYNRIIPLRRIIEAHRARANSRYEIAEYLCVTEEFLQNSINRYLDKYGIFTEHDRYLIVFEPLLVIDPFEK